MSLKYTATDGTTGNSSQSICVSGKNLGCQQCGLGTGGAGGNTVASNGSDGVGHPIDLASGNVDETFTDYATGGQNPLAFMRFYNSQAPATSLATTLGPNWRSNYDLYIRIKSATAVTLERGDGRTVECGYVASASQWQCEYDEGLTLAQSGSTWMVTDSQQNTETYTNAANGTQANLRKLAQRTGYTRTLAYNGSNQLSTVTDSYGRQLTLAYSSTLLHSVTTPDNGAIIFGYGNGQLSQVTYPTNPAASIAYGYSGPYLTRLTDENGNIFESWGYDAQGRAISNSRGGGIADAITIAYNADGSRTLTNALGQSETHKFASLMGLARVSEIDRAATSTTAAANENFTYDSTGRMATQSDWNGNQTQYQYMPNGHPISITEAAGTPQARTTTYVYDTTWPSQLSQVYMPLGSVNFTYDANGNVATKFLFDTSSGSSPYSTNGTKRTWTYTWTPTGQMASVQGPRTDLTQTTGFTYDASGALTKITNPLSQITQITSHTAGGRPLTIVDLNGIGTNLTYDGRQRLLTSAFVTNSAGTLTTTNTYDSAGNLTRSTLPDGAYRQYTYDTAHRTTRVADNSGSYIQYTLNNLGNVTDESEYSAGLLRRERQASYNALGRKLRDTSVATGTSIIYAYDGNGNVLSVTDGNSHKTSKTYDPLNRVATLTDAAINSVSYTYDVLDNPLTVTDQLGHVTSYTYDAFSDLIQLASPDSGITVNHYLPNGLLSQRTDGNGAVSNYTYDALDRTLTTSYPNSPGENVIYVYDQPGHSYGVGHLTSLTDAANTLSLAWDERGNRTYEARSIIGQNYITSYGYDAASRVSKIIYPSGWIFNYLHNASGEVSQVTLQYNASSPAYNVVSGVTWLGLGTVDSGLTFGNGVTETRSYDLDYRTTQITDRNSAGTALQSLAYGYDYADNVKTVTDGVTGTNSQSFGYDALDRLVNATGAYGAYAWSYDRLGNRLSEQVGALSPTTYTYAAGSNRLASVAGGGTTNTFGYSGAGDIAALTPSGGGGATSFVYNNQHRLSNATGPGFTSESYLYDAFGTRVTRIINSSPSVWLQSVFDPAGHLLEEYYGSAPQADYIWLGDRAVGVLNPSSGALSALFDDRLGTPQKAANGSQAVNWSQSLNPFGAGTSSYAIQQDLRLPGMEAGPATGYPQNGFRDYMPGYGRYLESDPIGLGGGLNTYGYAGANPVGRTDRWGLDDVLGGFFQAFLPVATSQFSNQPIGGSPQSQVSYGNQVNAFRSFEGNLAAMAISLGTFGSGELSLQETAACDAAQETQSVVLGGVYVLKDIDGIVMRSGRTGNLARRAAEHARDPLLKDYKFSTIYSTDVYSEQRGLEQILHDTHKPLLNRINPVSSNNPNFQDYMSSANNYLNNIQK